MTHGMTRGENHYRNLPRICYVQCLELHHSLLHLHNVNFEVDSLNLLTQRVLGNFQRDPLEKDTRRLIKIEA